jgi:hypothetical protein
VFSVEATVPLNFNLAVQVLLKIVLEIQKYQTEQILAAVAGYNF